MNGELLTTYGSRTGEEYCLALSALSLQKLINTFIVKVGVVVVHLLRVGTIKVYHIRRDSLAKVGLEAVHAHIHEHFQLVLEPFVSLRIGEIHDSHTRLPHIPLPYLTGRTLNKIALFHTLGK